MQRGIGRLRARASSGGPPTANMVAWYRKGVGISSAANAVSAWADQSGGTWGSLLQATGANQPQLQADGSIQTNGTNQFMKTGVFASIAQPLTIYMRVKQVATSASDQWLLDGGALGEQGARFSLATPTRLDVYAGVNFSGGPTVTTGAFNSVALVWNGAGSYVRVDASTSSLSNAGTTGRTGLTIGSLFNGTQPCSAQFAEIVAYTGAPDSARDALMMTYLNSVV